MEFPVTTAYVAVFLGFLQYVLMLTVGLARGPAGVSLGDGGNEALQRKIRRHGNLAENAPIFLILLGLLEMTGGSSMVVTWIGAVFLVARISHAIALSTSGSGMPFRPIGALGTIGAGVGAAGMLLYTVAM